MVACAVACALNCESFEVWKERPAAGGRQYLYYSVACSGTLSREPKACLLRLRYQSFWYARFSTTVLVSCNTSRGRPDFRRRKSRQASDRPESHTRSCKIARRGMYASLANTSSIHWTEVHEAAHLSSASIEYPAATGSSTRPCKFQ